MARGSDADADAGRAGYLRLRTATLTSSLTSCVGPPCNHDQDVISNISRSYLVFGFCLVAIPGLQSLF